MPALAQVLIFARFRIRAFVVVQIIDIPLPLARGVAARSKSGPGPSSRMGWHAIPRLRPTSRGVCEQRASLGSWPGVLIFCAYGGPRGECLCCPGVQGGARSFGPRDYCALQVSPRIFLQFN